jgi:hypothetical protein
VQCLNPGVGSPMPRCRGGPLKIDVVRSGVLRGFGLNRVMGWGENKKIA